ncbi:hypothetical protein JQ575_32060 [Bradyrhizobium sp. JYMT SZCCT0428]|nr:hypothetical protein [Bradyrhizobium sp. JYMT SZCCT0428]
MDDAVAIVLNEVKAHRCVPKIIEDRARPLHDALGRLTLFPRTKHLNALNAAYRLMKYTLGVLNMAARGYGVSERFGYPNAPIGTFMSASPIFLIDAASRKLGNWQSESHYPLAWKRNFSVWQGQDAAYITRFTKNVSSDLARIDFKEKLVQAVILFQEGLETSHVEVALLKFWTGTRVPLLVLNLPPHSRLQTDLAAPRSGLRSPNAGLAGWRRSADRTRLRAGSLQTGNFIGNLTIFASQRPETLAEITVC